MANRYWVGGTASWDSTAGTKWAATSGGAGGQPVPTNIDDVFFDANSGTGTVTITNSTAKSINCTGFTGTLTGSGSLTVYGSITLAAGMTMSHTGNVEIRGTATITSAGKSFANFNCYISGGTVTLGDAFTASGSFGVEVGTFNTNNNNLTCQSFVGTGTFTRTITLGSSTVTVTGGGGNSAGPTTYWDFTTTTGLTFNANTSQITFTNYPVNFVGGGLTYNNVSFTATTITVPQYSAINGANTFANLTFPNNVPTTNNMVWYFFANQTVTGTLTRANVSAAASASRVYLRSDTVGTARTLTCAAVSLTDVDVSDITGAGAASWTGTRIGDAKGNSGITFTAAKTVYWNLAGTNNITATGWATSSGGTPGVNNFPLAQDTAVIDNTGAATQINLVGGGTAGSWELPGYQIGTLNASSRTNAITLNVNGGAGMWFYGDVSLGTGVTVTTNSGSEAIYLGGRNTQTITSNGRTLNVNVVIDSPGGTVSLADALNCSDKSITVTRATLTTNNNNITAGSFSSSNANTRTLTLGSSTITLSGSWNAATSTGLTVTGSGTIAFNSASSKTFASGGVSYGTIVIDQAGAGTLTFSGSPTIGGISNSYSSTGATTITFTSGTTTTMSSFTATGAGGKTLTLNTTSTTSPATLNLTSGTYLTGIDFLSIRNVQALPVSDTWYVGSGSSYLTTPPNFGYGFITTQRSVYAVVVLTSTSSATWTVPSDWYNPNNEIHLIGGGGGGGGGTSATASGGGGGGGGYTKLVNQTLTIGAGISYQVGNGGSAGVFGGANGGAGSTTSWNSGAATAGGGGGGGTSSSAAGTAGVGSTANGGAGGSGSFAATNAASGAGGGGAGGPRGNGASGGNGLAADRGGGGGGGNSGGTSGVTGGISNGGAGGNNANGVGGGTSGVSGAVGGGGGGLGVAAASNILGGHGIEILGVGSGGGSGGFSSSASSSAPTVSGGGRFGGGGGGGSTISAGVGYNGSAGEQGAIIIVYGVGPTTAGSNFLLMF